MRPAIIVVDMVKDNFREDSRLPITQEGRAILPNLRRLVEEGVRKGEFPPGLAEEITWLTLGAVNVAMEVDLSHPEMSMGQKGLARVLELIFRAISSEPKGRKKEKVR